MYDLVLFSSLFLNPTYFTVIQSAHNEDLKTFLVDMEIRVYGHRDIRVYGHRGNIVLPAVSTLH